MHRVYRKIAVDYPNINAVKLYFNLGIEQRIFKEIDSYHYDDVLASFEINPHLTMEGLDNVIEVPIRKFKDFYPDQLYKNVGVFNKVSDLRLRLQNNSTFNDTLREIQDWFVTEESSNRKKQKFQMVIY